MTPSDSLTIGLYIDSYLPAVDGVIITVENYARRLHRPPAQRCYVASAEGPPGFVDSNAFPVIRYRSIPVPKRPPYRLGFPLLDRHFVASQHRLYPHLVHSHSPFAAGLEALRMAKLRHIPLVASFHSKYYDDIYAATGSTLIAQQAVDYIVSFYRQADAVWTVNEGTAGTLRDYGYKGPITIMPNGAEFTWPDDPDAARRRVKARYGLEEDAPVLLFVGQQIVQKNIPLILEAGKLLKEQGRPFHLLLVGEGRDAQALAAMARTLELDREVRFTGAEKDRSRLCEIYLTADLFVFPSVYDNAPLVVREAAMARCPAVLVAGSNAAERCKDGVDAYLCQNTALSLAQTIGHALDDPGRAQVGLAAREHIALPWEQVIEKVSDAYRAILTRQ